MPSVSRRGDSIYGTTAGEHSGHLIPCNPSPSTGSISGNCSPNVLVNGLPAARVGSSTVEYDSCCGSSSGSVGSGSSTVKVNGAPLARVGDRINAHNGSATISGGSSNVFAN